MNTLTTQASNLALKEKINKLAADQKFLKNQRKTKNIVGERIIPASQAALKHASNRYDLRILNMVIGLLKGRTTEQVESNPKTPINMREVNSIIQQYQLTNVENG